jgi:hypothetical protein
MKYLSLKFFIALLVAFSFASCTKNTEPVLISPPTNFHGIPPQGIGGDSLLNIKKNRWYAPQNYTDMSIADIMNLPHDSLSSMEARDRKNWTPGAALQAASGEAIGVRTTGYFIYARKEGKESCNGDDTNYVDFHLWIADSFVKVEDGSLIAEAIPYWKEQFPKWMIDTFQTMAFRNVQVRISGWIMWDEDHPEQLGKSRASLWEIHPITKFEYYSNGSWQTLQ